MRKAGGESLIVAKIERAEAITALEEILDASDAIMVARGDLAVEVGDAIVPALQKRMIRLARENPAFKAIVDRFIVGEPQAILLVEFAGDDRDVQLRKL